MRSEITLARLHDVIQLAMGWTDSHLHQFLVHGEAYSQPDFEMDELNPEVSDEKIVVEEVLPVGEGILYPRCLAGKRACPPEDVGGIWGYQDFLIAINNPMHPEHREMLEWVGGAFDPAAFDLADVNLGLLGLEWPIFRRIVVAALREFDDGGTEPFHVYDSNQDIGQNTCNRRTARQLFKADHTVYPFVSFGSP